MRRQLDADSVDLDTILGLAHYAYTQPMRLDMQAIQAAARRADYVVTQVDIRLQGTVLDESCASCEQAGLVIEVQGTKQKLHLQRSAEQGQNPPVDTPITLKASSVSWGEEHILFRPTSWTEL